MNPRFARHLEACNNWQPPGGRLAFRIGSTRVGWMAPGIAAALASFEGFTVGATEVTLAAEAAPRLPGVARALAARGHFRFRDEAFDVRGEAGGAALTTIDRGALPAFGIVAEGVHVNGLVRRADGLHLWVAVRAADKLLDPGKLDHVVAGGISAGMTAEETLLKEAAEEAAIPAEVAAQARHVGVVRYAMMRDEGLRRDILQCYDLDLPETFVPRAADGEVERFELWPVARVADAVRDGDEFKFNVNLVLIDLFRRFGSIPL